MREESRLNEALLLCGEIRRFLEVIMLNREEILEKLETLTSPIFQSINVDLVDIEFGADRGKGLVRIYIDRVEGVTIDDCETVSRKVSELLDSHEELIPGSYMLEVSSPGLDRPFKTHRDYQRYLGRLVKIVTKSPVSGKNVFVGLLDDFKEGRNGKDSRVILQEEEALPPTEIHLNDVAVARLEVNWNTLFGERKKKPKRKR